ncbi:hypothetical protein [Roseovarius pacificus]|uniref:hypothetical protein n=1 Tax=Roseovarius pacificus TaxID=337701 RepID=UPI002A1890E8|nr:hypothetical protein [Roseovarius pacificus]
MTKYLDVNDVLRGLHSTENPRYDVHRKRLEYAINLAAKELADYCGFIFEKAETDLGFGGLRVAMRPIVDMQMWPEVLEDIDPDGSFD